MGKKQVRLVAFDLDGTLVRGETVCEVLARSLKREERMRQIESIQMDLAAVRASREEMASWYKGIPADQLCSYLVGANLAPGASEGIQLLKQAGIKTAIVSVTWEFAVGWFAKSLGVDYYVGTKLLPAGRIEHFWPQDKPIWLAEVAKSLGSNLDEFAAVGDSMGDIQMLQEVGHPFFVGMTVPKELRNVVHMPLADIRLVVGSIIGTHAGKYE